MDKYDYVKVANPVRMKAIFLSLIEGGVAKSIAEKYGLSRVRVMQIFLQGRNRIVQGLFEIPASEATEQELADMKEIAGIQTLKAARRKKAVFLKYIDNIK